MKCYTLTCVVFFSQQVDDKGRRYTTYRLKYTITWWAEYSTEFIVLDAFFQSNEATVNMYAALEVNNYINKLQVDRNIIWIFWIIWRYLDELL